MTKKIIICADGTGNTQEKLESGKPCPTHVVRVARALRTKDHEGAPQVIFYHAGVGTQTGLKLRGGALGRGVWANILDCYRFLVHNYAEGDLIYIFGFSRGAFTARSLAGLILNCGLLKRGEENSEREALELYRDPDPLTAADSDRSREFRARHSLEPEIEFMGIWDTVGSLGVSFLSGHFHFLNKLNWDFHDDTLSNRVKHAYHALAIHERRTKFLPTLWKMPEQPRAGQVLEQMWFSGVHSDVGGGYADHALGDCSLEWMIEKAGKCGLSFGRDSIADVQDSPTGAMHNSFDGFYPYLDAVMGHPGGSQRTFGGSGGPTCEEIHGSVRKRFAQRPDDDWPPTFRRALGDA